jgi:putative RecB family exonuclease
MTIYSHSRITTFEQCPLKYKFQYIDGIRSETENIEAFMGKLVHRVMQKLYADLLHTRLNELSELLDYYHHLWQQYWHQNIRIVKQEYSPENYKKMGEKCIKNYYKNYAPFDSEKTLALEVTLATDLGDSRSYKFRGIVDRLAQRPDGTYEIHDYKTSGTLPSQSKIDSDRQLALYQLAGKNEWNLTNYNVELVWHYLLFNKELRSKRAAEELQQLREETIELIQQIESCCQFPSRESILCDWCEYDYCCPRRKHLAKLTSLEENEYLKDDGVMLVEKYARLKNELNRLGKELDKLKEAIISYARKEKLEVMLGRNNKLNIKIEDKLKLPDKSQQNHRQELEELIQAEGKWMEVSQLNTHALNKVLMQERWSAELIEKVKLYARIEKSYSIYLAKLSQNGQLILFDEEVEER